MKIGIIGLPNVGKSTLFKALTKKEVDISNYPFCTINPNIGIVQIPDERLEKIALLSQSEKIIPTVIEVVDIAGLVKNAHKGEGLGNQFLSHIREVEAIIEVVRSFENIEVVHLEGEINPQRDIEIIQTELILKDLETVEKALPRFEKEKKANITKASERLQNIIQLSNHLKENRSALNLSENEKIIANELQLLTLKPIIYFINGDPTKIDLKNFPEQALIFDLKNENEKFNELIKKSYEILGLISFFTILSKETRAWTIKKGIKVKQAGRVIHADFEEKFIRANIVNYEKFLEAGGWQNAKSKGLLRTEGKDYIVQDGDIIEFKI